MFNNISDDEKNKLLTRAGGAALGATAAQTLGGYLIPRDLSLYGVRTNSKMADIKAKIQRAATAQRALSGLNSSSVEAVNAVALSTRLAKHQNRLNRFATKINKPLMRINRLAQAATLAGGLGGMWLASKVYED